jgi:hypothetical protein
VERVILAVALVAAAGVAALILGRRRPDPPTQERVAVPRQLDRRDFTRPDAPWLVVVFTSVTCQSCERATERARQLESAEVAYQEVSWQTGRDLHERYGVSDAPLILIADALGVVHRSFAGTPTLAHLAAAAAEARQPGSTPEPDAGRIWVDE